MPTFALFKDGIHEGDCADSFVGIDTAGMTLIGLNTENLKLPQVEDFPQYLQDFYLSRLSWILENIAHRYQTGVDTCEYVADIFTTPMDWYGQVWVASSMYKGRPVDPPPELPEGMVSMLPGLYRPVSEATAPLDENTVIIENATLQQFCDVNHRFDLEGGYAFPCRDDDFVWMKRRENIKTNLGTWFRRRMMANDDEMLKNQKLDYLGEPNNLAEVMQEYQVSRNQFNSLKAQCEAITDYGDYLSALDQIFRACFNSPPDPITMLP